MQKAIDINSAISGNLLEEIQKCEICESIIGHKKFPTTSYRQLGAKYILVSEAPDKDSLEKGKYWLVAGGQILRDCTNKAKE